MTIDIVQEADSAEEMALVLEYIASQIKEGNTSGYYPTWSLIDDEEDLDAEG